MGEHDEELRKIARERMQEMPGETAAGRIDPETLPDRERADLARQVAEDGDDQR